MAFRRASFLLSAATCVGGRFLAMTAVEEVEDEPPLLNRRRLTEVQASSEDSLIESAAFVVGVSVGMSSVFLILITVGICLLCYKRKRPATIDIEKPVLDSLELTPSLQKYRRSSDGRVSFMRDSLREDAVLRAIEDLELENIEFSASLGRGAFGKVYRGEYAGIPLAIKVLDHDGAGLSHGDEPLETYLSRNTDHPNVVKTFVNETRRCQSFAPTTMTTSIFRTPPGALSQTATTAEQRGSSSGDSDDEFSYMARAMGTTETEDNYRTWIVMEFCDRGSLDQAIKNKVFFQDGHVLQPKIRFMLLTALDIASAMIYLHKQNIVHGDLKSQNVLLSRSEVDERGFTCKVGDFGLSRVIVNKTHIDTFTHGTVSHSAPELFKQGLLTPAADIYSFGILLWELFTGEKAYTGIQHNGIIIAVTRTRTLLVCLCQLVLTTGGIRPVLPLHCPAPLANLITDCWRDAYFDRPSFQTIVERLIPLLRDSTSLETPVETGEPEAHLNNLSSPEDLSCSDDIENKDDISKYTSSQSSSEKGFRVGRRIEALSISTEKRSLEIAASRQSNGESVTELKVSEEETETEYEWPTTPNSSRSL